MDIIVRCSCGGVTTYLQNSLELLKLTAPSEENTFVGKDKIRKLAANYPGTPFAEHLGVIAKKSGRYAYYISTNNPADNKSQEIVAMYNLIKGQKVY